MPRALIDLTGDGEHVNAMASRGYDGGKGAAEIIP